MKLRTTPNAWQAALAQTSGDVRAWLETQAEVHPSVVNLDLNTLAPIAAKAADALRSGQYAGRIKGAIQKIVDALSGTPQAAEVAVEEPTVVQTPEPVVQAPVELPESVEAPASAPVGASEASSPKGDAEVDLVMNPVRSIRDSMVELANSLKGK